MKYSKFEHIINISFLIAVFAFPISECFINNRLAYHVGVSIINLAGLVAILLFLDFYKFKMTNEIKGIAFYLGLGLLTIVVSLLLASLNGLSLTSNMFIGENFQVWNTAWLGSYSAQVLYMLGLSLCLTCFGLVLRLGLMNLVRKASSDYHLATN